MIARDCQVDGVTVQATGGVEIVNATFMGNGTAVHALGSAQVKNSLVTGNGTGFTASADGTITSRYDDLFGNQTDRLGAGAPAGEGDIAVAVAFADLTGRNLRFLGAQGTTDKGDPADLVGDEPAPNGGRINLGAFGGTIEAETSALSTTSGGGTTGAGSPTSDPPPAGTPPGPAPTVDEPPADAGGCAVAAPRGDLWALLLLALFVSLPLVIRRRQRALARRQQRRG